jgi:hypothetical protein
MQMGSVNPKPHGLRLGMPRLPGENLGAISKGEIPHFVRSKTEIIFFFFALLGFELRAYTLSHSTSPFLWWVFSR